MTTAPAIDSPPLAPATRLGAVRLIAADAEALAGFYEQAIGLRRLPGSVDGIVRLGVADAPLIELHSVPGARPRPARTTGLFHLALLVPERAELARALERAVRAGARFGGASDHLVSEALYLEDPEGNGIELYADRRRAAWGTDAHGELAMATLPLDLESLLAEPHGGAGGMPPDTVLGHVHLNVADLEAAEAFYAGVVGFDVTVRGYPGALFVAAGGYHHHLGLNTWAGSGAPAPPPGARGLERFDLLVPERADLEAIARRAAGAGAPGRPADGGLLLTDPSGNAMLVRVAATRRARV
jgi:catechol 2,3-dioxygenase